MRPSSSSWFTRHQPCVRAWRMRSSKVGRSVAVWAVWRCRGSVARRLCSSSSGRLASSTRPMDVQAAGRREPTPRLVCMILWVGTRSP